MSAAIQPHQRHEKLSAASGAPSNVVERGAHLTKATHASKRDLTGGGNHAAQKKERVAQEAAPAAASAAALGRAKAKREARAAARLAYARDRAIIAPPVIPNRALDPFGTHRLRRGWTTVWWALYLVAHSMLHLATVLARRFGWTRGAVKPAAGEHAARYKNAGGRGHHLVFAAGSAVDKALGLTRLLRRLAPSAADDATLRGAPTFDNLATFLGAEPVEDFKLLALYRNLLVPGSERYEGLLDDVRTLATHRGVYDPLKNAFESSVAAAHAAAEMVKEKLAGTWRDPLYRTPDRRVWSQLGAPILGPLVARFGRLLRAEPAAAAPSNGGRRELRVGAGDALLEYTDPLYGPTVHALLAALRPNTPMAFHREYATEKGCKGVSLDWGWGCVDVAFPNSIGEVRTEVGMKKGDVLTTRCLANCHFVHPNAADDDTQAALQLRNGSGRVYYENYQCSKCMKRKRDARALSDGLGNMRNMYYAPKGLVLVLGGLDQHDAGSAPVMDACRALMANGYDTCILRPAPEATLPGGTTTQARAALLAKQVQQVLDAHFSSNKLRAHYANLCGLTAADVPTSGVATPRVFLIGLGFGGRVVADVLAQQGLAHTRRVKRLAAHKGGDEVAAEAELAQRLDRGDVAQIHAAFAVCSPWGQPAQPKGAASYLARLLNGTSLRKAVRVLREQAAALEAPFEIDITPAQPHAAVPPHLRTTPFQRLGDVRTPLMIISTSRDPVVGAALPDAQWEAIATPAPGAAYSLASKADPQPNANGAIAYLRVPSGGHLGFTAAPLDVIEGRASYLNRLLVQVVGAGCADNGANRSDVAQPQATCAAKPGKKNDGFCPFCV